MKFLTKRTDGGPESNVTGYWLIEWKSVFSIALLRFRQGSREAYHSHAFNAWSLILWGSLVEVTLLAGDGRWPRTVRRYLRRGMFLHTPREQMHKVYGIAKNTWAISFRGPWSDTWEEVLKDGSRVTLTHGRKVVAA